MRERILWGAVGAGVLTVAIVIGLLAFMRSGAYDIAASSEHTGPVRWALSTVQENAVRAHAARDADDEAAVGGGDGGNQAITADTSPALPTDSAALRHGFVHFEAMCVVCHGAPGREPGEIGQGLNPSAPSLDDAAEEWTDRELFWIVKNGFKMTGMPAFGPTHDDDQIRGIVAFLNVLPEMSEEEYRGLAERWQSEIEAHDHSGEAEGHSHAPGTPEHSH